MVSFLIPKQRLCRNSDLAVSPREPLSSLNRFFTSTITHSFLQSAEFILSSSLKLRLPPPSMATGTLSSAPYTGNPYVLIILRAHALPPGRCSALAFNAKTPSGSTTNHKFDDLGCCGGRRTHSLKSRASCYDELDERSWYSNGIRSLVDRGCSPRAPH